MAFPTDVRQNYQEFTRGINSIWNGSGTDVPANALVTLKTVVGAGQIQRLVFQTLSQKMCCYVLLDDVHMTAGGTEAADYFLAGMGCLEKQAYLRWSKLDTVNNRYVMLIEGPLQFGNKMEIKLENREAVAAKAYVKCNWLQNV